MLKALCRTLCLFVLPSQLLGQQPLLETQEYRDLLYVPTDAVANDSLQRLSLVVPKTEGTHPTLIWIGGGAWSYVDRNMELDFAHKMAEQGIAVASVGHRLSSAVWRDPKLNTGIQHPKHSEDVAQAVKWLYDHANDYELNVDQLYIGGYSSGAHLAALLSLDATYLKAVGLSPDIFKGVLPLSGTFDIPNYHHVFKEGNRPELAEQHVEAVFGSSPAQMQQASPVHYLDQLSAPLLIICDNGVYRYTRLFEDRVRETGFTQMQVVYSHDLSHADLWRNLSFADHSPYRRLMVDFIRSPQVN